MADYDRIAMILDSPASELGPVAIRLLTLGLDVLYTKDPDEADLLCRQEGSRLGALLAPVDLDRSALEAVLDRVCPKLAAGARALVLVGKRPEPPRLDTLREAGITWRLWEPYDERELRFVMTAAMAAEHDADRRRELRVPSAIETTVFVGRHRKEVVVHDLSADGAYLATPHPFLAGSRLSVEIPLADHTMRCKAEVMQARTVDDPGREDVPEGMGITFTHLSPADTEALHAFLRRFRL